MFFGPLSKAYMEICKKQTREFFGLRDFYRYGYFTYVKLWEILWGNTADQRVKKSLLINQQCFMKLKSLIEYSHAHN